MKSTALMFVIFVSCVGCGFYDRVSHQSGEPQAAQDEVGFNVADRAALPPCTDSIGGVLAYVRAERTLLLCESGTWATLDIRGRDGSNGERGETGKNGDTGKDGSAGKDGVDGSRGDAGVVGEQGIAGTNGIDGVDGVDGADGIDNHIVTRYECAVTMNDNSAYFGADAYYGEYTLDVTSWGDVIAWARWFNGSGQWTINRAYPKNHADASNGRVIYKLNLAGGSVNCGQWTVTLNRSTDAVTFRYDDADMPGIGGVYQKTATCTVTQY